MSIQSTAELAARRRTAYSIIKYEAGKPVGCWLGWMVDRYTDHVDFWNEDNQRVRVEGTLFELRLAAFTHVVQELDAAGNILRPYTSFAEPYVTWRKRIQFVDPVSNRKIELPRHHWRYERIWNRPEGF